MAVFSSAGRKFTFFCGICQPCDAKKVSPAFISVNRMRTRKSRLDVGDWIMDSGAFTEISRHGCYRTTPEEYAAEIRRWTNSGNLIRAVSQDWMCEPWIIEKTGLSVAEHQRLTVERYGAIVAADPGVEIMPVIQGFEPEEYVRHLAMYGDRFEYGKWVGVGSVCKRNGNPLKMLAVLEAIKKHRPDLRLHGFGVKLTALANRDIVRLLFSSDSMAWSFAARRSGKKSNDWRIAEEYVKRIRELTEWRELE